MFALAALVVGCALPPGPPPTRDEVHRAEVWVDGFSPTEGDGTEAHPLKRVPQRVEANTTLHLRSGVYAGPFVFGEGTQVEGTGEVVLTAEAGQTVVTATKASLRGLSLQGGDLGLDATIGVTLSKVRFSGQRQQLARVTADATMEDVTFVGTVEGIEGVVVERGAKLTLSNATFSGGLKRGVQTEGGRLVLSRVKSDGVRTLVRALDADLDGSDLTAVAGVGPAVFVSGGHAKLRELTVRGHEYGLQLGRDTKAEVVGLTVSNTAQSCLGVVQATLTLERANLSHCGLGAGVELLDSTSTISALTVNKTDDVGLLLRKGTLTLSKSSFSFITTRSEALGDALQLRNAVAKLEAVRVSDVDGSALFASAFAEVTVGSLDVERAHRAAVFIERGAQVHIDTLLVRGGQGPAVVVPDASKATLKSVSVAGGTELPIYAECREGAVVEVGRLESTVAPLPSRCITTLR